jgi:putative ABC transport system permease protein
MFKNYFKTAWRNLIKNKFFNAINIVGLAVGMAGFIIILLYLNYELSYDTWDASLKKVYKISEQSDEDIWQATPAPLASFLKQHVPIIVSATRIQAQNNFKILLAVGEKKIYQEGGIDVDSSFFKVFPYLFIEGNASTALGKPNVMVISKELSTKLFGNVSPIGKTIKVFNAFDCEVTGILQTPKTPSILNTQFVFRSPYENQNMFWGNLSYQTFVKTVLPIENGKLEKEVDSIFYNLHLKNDGQSLTAFRKAGHQAGLFVDAFSKLHNFPKHGNSNFTTISFLLLLAALLLLAGAINFSNLSIAAAMARAKEVGVRKVLGSLNKQLILQFMMEIGMQCLVSLCLALLFVKLILPYFNDQFSVHLSILHSGSFISIAIQIITCLFLVTLLSGLYPSLFLSRYNITKVLKGNYSTGKKGIGFRNALIVFQFSVSAFFIIGTLVIHQQMHYMQSKDKGFSGEQVLCLRAPQSIRDRDFDITRNTLLTIPSVEYVSKSTTVPGDEIIDTTSIPYRYNGKEFRMSSVKVSDDYFKTLSVPLLNGRLFNNSTADENTRSAIINESAAHKLGLQNPIGATITFPYCDSVPVQIVGVVKDFHVSGFEDKVRPVVFTVGNNACMMQSGGALLVKLNSKDLPTTMKAIESSWKKISPDFPIQYSFLDKNFERLFSSYMRLQVIIDFFAFTAIFISVIGLFALTTYLINRRMKEIGIRKILGANLRDISILLGKDFVRLVLIATLIAGPIGWWAANKWLQSFAYRIELSWLLFLYATLVLLFIAVLTIGIQAMRAALANPVKSLRTE